MSNKPIAWIDLRRGGIVTFDAVWASKVDDKKPIPLYTHPVKELTDEEITELKNALKGSEYKTYPSKKQWESYLVLEKYAERLLRKAQNV